MTQEILFQSPERAFLLLFAILFAWLYWLLARSRKRRVESRFLQELWPSWIPKRDRAASALRVLCLCTAWGLFCLSFMRPVTETTKPGAISKIALDEVAFFLDVSRSMNVADTLSGQSRLARAKDIIEAIIEKLSGVNISLYAFAGSVSTPVPPTEDYFYFRINLAALESDDVPVAGTDFGEVVAAVEKDSVEGPTAKSTLFVLLTDGEDTTEQDMQPVIEKAGQMKQDWVIIGLGTTKGAIVPGVQYNGSAVISKMDEKFLESLAQTVKGRLYFDNRMTFSSLVDSVVFDIAFKRSPEMERQKVLVEKEPYLLPLQGALFLLLIALIIPQRKRRKAVIATLLFLSTIELRAASTETSIEQAISLTEAGRDDLALSLLQRLLAEPLSDYDRSIVLYDAASLLSRNHRYKEALDRLRQIELAPALLRERVAYDGAMNCLKIVDVLQDPVSAEVYLEEAKEYLARLRRVPAELQEALARGEQNVTFAKLQEALRQETWEIVRQRFVEFLRACNSRLSLIYQDPLYVEDFWQQNAATFAAFCALVKKKSSAFEQQCSRVQARATAQDGTQLRKEIDALIQLLLKEKAEQKTKAPAPQEEKAPSTKREYISPAKSLGLLQEMQRDDAKLQEVVVKKSEGPRPW